MFRLLAIAVCLPCVAWAFPSIPPKSDKAKENPPSEQSKPEEIDVHKTAERIAENAQKAGDRLKEKDPGADTRQIQKDILKDIDALIKKAQQPPPPPMSSDMNPMMPPPPMGQGGMGGGNSPKPMGGMGGSGEKSPTPMGGASGGAKQKSPAGSGASRRQPRQRRPRGSSRKDGSEPMANAGPNGKEPRPAKLEPMQPGAGGGDKSDFGGGFGKSDSKRERDKLAQLYKDVWGELPERMRQEMDLYYREQFMPRYSELLRRYYAALAEQKKKGSENR